MRLIIGLCSALCLLSACGTIGNSAGSFGGGSSAGGSSWFGKKQKGDPAVVVPKDTRAYIPVIKSAATDDTKGGVILRVVGLTSRVGYFGVDLVLSDKSTSSTLVYELRANAPSTWDQAKTERQREIQAAIFIPSLLEPQARSITVIGAENQKTIRR